MKSKLTIFLFFLCLNVFGQVPDNATFNLQNVVDVVNPTTDDLVDCFTDSDAAKFDPAYGSKAMSPQTLLGFRNYGVYAPIAYSDWQLSASLDLVAMYDELKTHGIGSFADAAYWSTYDCQVGVAFTAILMTDASYYCRDFHYEYHVRAIRTFTSSTDDYDLRDEGPAGGWIYKKHYDLGLWSFYECTPSDQSTGAVHADAITICNNLVIYH